MDRKFKGYAIETVTWLAKIEQKPRPPEKPVEKIYTLEEIWNDVCECMLVDPERAKKKTRKREIVRARQIFCYVVREMYHNHYSLKAIGDFLGGRDHTTVIHSKDLIKDWLEIKDPQFMREWYNFLSSTKIYRRET